MLRVVRRLRRGYRGDAAANIEISAREASDRVFCFAGEFGYELISWLPYLLFLKQKLDIRMVTCGRPGSRTLYNFSDQHHQFGEGVVGDMWGDVATYESLQALLGGSRIIFPRPTRTIRIEGHAWQVRDIHATISGESYALLDYSEIRLEKPFHFDRPFVVINNKFIAEWGHPPINYFSREDLVTLRNFLSARGYALVYNHFKEHSRTDRVFDLDDGGIFGTTADSYDLSDYYLGAPDIGDRNQMQISLFNQAAFVIAPQGGSAYLPAICRKDLLMLMRQGSYADYLELGRLYRVNVEVFYEVRHLLAWLAETLRAP